jgi:hypothetical protein
LIISCGTAILNQAAQIDALRQQCEAMAEALQWAKEMFVARDEMNSKVHCAPVRLSPITDRVILVLVQLTRNLRRVGE